MSLDFCVYVRVHHAWGECGEKQKKLAPFASLRLFPTVSKLFPREPVDCLVPQSLLGKTISHLKRGDMEQLPPELLLYIFQFASVSETPIMTRVCSLWRSVWQDQALWKYFHCRDLGCVVKPPLRSDQWRESYRVVVATIDRLKYWNSSAERIKRAATMDAGVWVLRELESYPLSKSLFAETIELGIIFLAHFSLTSLSGSFSTAFMLLKRYYKDSFRPHEVGDFIFRVGATSGNLTLITDLYEMGIYQRLRPFDSDVAMATDPEVRCSLIFLCSINIRIQSRRSSCLSTVAHSR